MEINCFVKICRLVIFDKFFVYCMQRDIELIISIVINNSTECINIKNVEFILCLNEITYIINITSAMNKY